MSPSLNEMLLYTCRYLMSQIQEGAGKEIRCPEHNCFKVVPNVSACMYASRRGPMKFMIQRLGVVHM